MSNIFLVFLFGAAVQTAIAAPPLRQSFDMQISLPPMPVKIDGTQKLIYELHLTNFSRDELDLQRLEVVDAERGIVIAGVDNKALAQRIGRISTSAAESALALAPGARAVVYLELALEGGKVPESLIHRIEFARAGTTAVESVEGGRVPVRAAPPVRLGPPVAGGPWAAVHHPSWPRGHRRVFYAVDGRARLPGRFAIDWFKLDAAGKTAEGNSDVTGNWFGYGEPVLAVADAVVAALRDDVGESATLSGRSPTSLADASGNYVALDLGGGRYAFYEHLKPGSICVEPGQRVARGEPIAAIGFTGSSTGPHLHFHVADANSPLGAEGLPFVIDVFTLLGRYESFDAFGKRPWQAPDDPRSAQRRMEWPAPNVVVEFPAHGARQSVKGSSSGKCKPQTRKP